MSTPYGDPSYQDPPRPQSAYQQQPPPYQPYQFAHGQLSPYGPPPEHPNAMVVLILGILGFFVGVTGPVAWIMGSKARKEVKADPGRYRDGGMLQVGWILGIVTTALMVVGIIFGVIYAIAIIALIAGSGI